MRVIAFTGPSGTGKSSKAIEVARNYGLEGIIDDGLLIKGVKILVGNSAKNEKFKVQAVKRAIFIYREDAEAVKKAIKENNINSLLIIGTSDKMVRKICINLVLPQPEEFVHIQDISSKNEMSKARKRRLGKNEHVIPVPTMEIKEKRIDALLSRSKEFFRRHTKDGSEQKSFVRPEFSEYGRLTIEDNVIPDIVKLKCASEEQISKVLNIKVIRPENVNNGVRIFVDLELYLDGNIGLAGEEIGTRIHDKVEMMTSLPVKKPVNITIKSVVKRK